MIDLSVLLQLLLLFDSVYHNIPTFISPQNKSTERMGAKPLNANMSANKL